MSAVAVLTGVCEPTGTNLTFAVLVSYYVQSGGFYSLLCVWLPEKVSLYDGEFKGNAVDKSDLP